MIIDVSVPTPSNSPSCATTPDDSMLITKPVAVRMVYQVANAVNIPIIGMGGIASAEDALEFIMAGATMVAVGTANFNDPMTTIKVIEGIQSFMKKNGIKDIAEITGCVK